MSRKTVRVCDVCGNQQDDGDAGKWATMQATADICPNHQDVQFVLAEQWGVTKKPPEPLPADVVPVKG